MVDSEDTLFSRWQEVDNDACFVNDAQAKLGFDNIDFAALPLCEMRLVLALALHLKRVAQAVSAFGRA